MKEGEKMLRGTEPTDFSIIKEALDNIGIDYSIFKMIYPYILFI